MNYIHKLKIYWKKNNTILYMNILIVLNKYSTIFLYYHMMQNPYPHSYLYNIEYDDYVFIDMDIHTPYI